MCAVPMTTWRKDCVIKQSSRLSLCCCISWRYRQPRRGCGEINPPIFSKKSAVLYLIPAGHRRTHWYVKCPREREDSETIWCTDDWREKMRDANQSRSDGLECLSKWPRAVQRTTYPHLGTLLATRATVTHTFTSVMHATISASPYIRTHHSSTCTVKTVEIF